MSNDISIDTPFHKSTERLNQTPWWYGWGPYMVPDIYTDFHTEMDAIRKAVSMNEMSPLPKIKVAGPDAQKAMDWLMPRNIMKMQPGYAWYMPWCNEAGILVGDGIVFYLKENEFIITCDYCISHLKNNSKNFDVEISEVTDDYGILALQGPSSQQVLEAVTGEDWSDLAFCRIRHTTIDGVKIHVARQGFTGEHGYELWVKRNGNDACTMWDAVHQAGQAFGIQPAGEYAIEVTRVEAGLILTSADYIGVDLDKRCASVVDGGQGHVSPYELGLGYCVNLSAGDFVGKQALTEENDRGAARKLVGLELDLQSIVDVYMNQGLMPDVSQRVRWDRMVITKEGKEIGQATSITWSPTSKRMIGFACIANEHTDEGTEFTVQWLDYWGKSIGDVKAKVVSTPFIELKRS